MCTSTYSGPWQPLSAIQRQELADALAQRGLQLTLQREAVYEAALGCPGHICAEHILAVANDSHPGLRMDKATVYRNISLLVNLGLVSAHECGQGPNQYEAASRGQHAHLLCRNCGALVDLDPDLPSSLRQDVLQRYGFLVQPEDHLIVGLCATCRS